MRYFEFKETILCFLIEHPEGAVWKDLRERLRLPYKIPCLEWTRRLENEIGLTRVKGSGRAFLWKIESEKK